MLRAFRKYTGISALRRVLKDRSGVAAIEFAMLFPFFFTLTLYSIEIGWTVTRTVLFANAVRQVSKQIYVGTAHDTGLDSSDLEELICDTYILATVGCKETLVLELIEISDVGDNPEDGNACVQRDDDGVIIRPPVEFDPGGASSIIFVRACLVLDLLLPGLEYAVSASYQANNLNYMVATTAFVNEPF